MLTQPIGTKRETPSRAYSFDFSRAKPRAPQLPAWGSPADSTGVRTTDLEILLDTPRYTKPQSSLAKSLKLKAKSISTRYKNAIFSTNDTAQAGKPTLTHIAS